MALEYLSDRAVEVPPARRLVGLAERRLRLFLRTLDDALDGAHARGAVPVVLEILKREGPPQRVPDPLEMSGRLISGTGEALTLASGSVSQPSTTNVLRTDWLFSYRPNPGTVFFLGYGGNMNEQDPLAFNRLRRTGDALFVKMSYLFRVQ